MREICSEDAAGVAPLMRAFLLSLACIVLIALPAQAQSKPKVLRSITTAPTSKVTSQVTASLVAQTPTITLTLRYGTDTTYSSGSIVRTIVSNTTTTYVQRFDLAGLVHGTKYFVQVEAKTDVATETKTLEFTQTLDPIAKSDRLTLTSFTGTRAFVLRNDFDPDNVSGAEPDDDLSIKRVTQPAFGRAEIVGKAIMYHPGVTFRGTDEFEYVVTDQFGGTAKAVVTVSGLQFSVVGTQALLLRDLQGDTAGYLQIGVSRAGSFTGTLELGDKSYALLGSFDGAGKFLGYARSGSKLVPVELALTQDEDGLTRIEATLANGTIVAADTVSSQTFDSLEELAGRYTIELPAGSGDSESDDFGTGWAIMEIEQSGDVEIEGETGDRRKFSAGAVLSGSPEGPVVSFYAQQRDGSLAGVLSVGDTISGELTWTREETDSEFYPGGFDITVNANGGRWVEPEDDQRALELDGGDADKMTISISGGDVPEFEQELEISEDDRVTVIEPAADALNMKIDRDDGRFKGKFRHLDDPDRRSKIRGILLQGEGRGSGVFEGNGKAGLVEITTGSTDSPDPVIPDPVIPDPGTTPQPDPDPLDPLDPVLPDPLFNF